MWLTLVNFEKFSISIVNTYWYAFNTITDYDYDYWLQLGLLISSHIVCDTHWTLGFDNDLSFYYNILFEQYLFIDIDIPSTYTLLIIQYILCLIIDPILLCV